MKKVLIISVSLRKNSNSDLLAQQFAKGAQEAGYQVETISLLEKNIQFCTGLYGLPESTQMCHSGRCECHC